MNARYFLAALLFLSCPEAAFAMRCGTSLVVEGQSKFDVLQRCGQPAYTDSRLEYRWAPGWYGARPLGTPEGYYPPGSVRQVIIDEWVYNFGSTQLMPSLIFEDGRLITIRSLGYGR